jgi:hypothetical protein
MPREMTDILVVDDNELLLGVMTEVFKALLKDSQQPDRLCGGWHARTSDFPPDEVGFIDQSKPHYLETGPRMYIHANTHPHLGKCFVITQLAAPSKIKPTNETTFNDTECTF